MDISKSEIRGAGYVSQNDPGCTFKGTKKEAFNEANELLHKSIGQKNSKVVSVQLI